MVTFEHNYFKEMYKLPIIHVLGSVTRPLLSASAFKTQYPLNPAAWLVPSWDLALELTPCMFYEHLIPLRLQAKFSVALCVCVCVLSAPPGTRTTVSVPFLGELYYQGCVMASCYFPPFTVDAVCHWGISLAHRHAGCCGLPDPVMKAFRCLETYHFPQLCIPKLHSDETCLYHSHDNLDISVISTWKHKLYFLSMCKFEGQLLWRENPT